LQLPCFAYATQHIYNLTKKKNRKKKKAIAEVAWLKNQKETE
jgi:hypothetical protein